MERKVRNPSPLREFPHIRPPDSQRYSSATRAMSPSRIRRIHLAEVAKLLFFRADVKFAACCSSFSHSTLVGISSSVGRGSAPSDAFEALLATSPARVLKKRSSHSRSDFRSKHCSAVDILWRVSPNSTSGQRTYFGSKTAVIIDAIAQVKMSSR